MDSVNYLDSNLVADHRLTDLPYVATVYGEKIPTRHQLLIKNRWYRVYMVQKANAGSAYVVIRGVRCFLRDSDIL